MNVFFLRVNVAFYDALNVIHDVITTANPFPYTAKFMFVGYLSDHKYPTRLGEMIIFSPRLENYEFSQPLKIFFM